MKVGVLTSSRADFGIYLPLLKQLNMDSDVDLKIIAFGTHCSKFHGETIQEIEEADFKEIDKICTVLASDDEESITTSYGLTIIKFATYWVANKYDIVFCLGDRYEMSAAVQAGIPHQIKFAHIHGGETTLGAIDNVYRHQITIASTLHFTSTERYKEKVKSLVGSNKHVYNVGALSLDGVEEIVLVKEDELRRSYDIPDGDFILSTFHPETVSVGNNEKYAGEMAEAIKELANEFIFVITMPNADTLGSVYRKAIKKLKECLPERIVTVENFGKRNYFSAMKYASLLLGNTSSGIVEAASFKKYVVNVGDRQKGRAQSNNIINCPFEANQIVDSVQKANQLGKFNGENIYYRENVADNIMKKTKLSYETL